MHSLTMERRRHYNINSILMYTTVVYFLLWCVQSLFFASSYDDDVKKIRFSLPECSKGILVKNYIKLNQRVYKQCMMIVLEPEKIFRSHFRSLFSIITISNFDLVFSTLLAWHRKLVVFREQKWSFKYKLWSNDFLCLWYFGGINLLYDKFISYEIWSPSATRAHQQLEILNANPLR